MKMLQTSLLLSFIVGVVKVVTAVEEPCDECCVPDVEKYSNCFKDCITKCLEDLTLPIVCVLSSSEDCGLLLSDEGDGLAYFDAKGNVVLEIPENATGSSFARVSTPPIAYNGTLCVIANVQLTAPASVSVVVASSSGSSVTSTVPPSNTVGAMPTTLTTNTGGSVSCTVGPRNRAVATFSGFNLTPGPCKQPS